MVKVKPTMQKKKFSKPKVKQDNKIKNKVMKINKKPGKTHRGRRRIHKKQERQATGVVYISHIPHGFYEEQIDRYFSQFGKVNAVSVPRSRSGRARGYAFIEYKYPEIAKIAAETMDNYLMSNRLLKAKYIPPEEQKPHLFRIAKLARENHKTAADKKALALRQIQILKNRHLRLHLEEKYATKLLKKKGSLMKRAEQLGLSQNFLVEEGNVQSIKERQREVEASKKSKSSERDLKPERGEEKDASEEELSSSDSEDVQSLEDLDFSSEDMDETDSLSEGEENYYKSIISQAKKAAEDILKKKLNPTKLKKPSKDQPALNASAKLASQKQSKQKLILSQKAIISENKAMSLKNSQPKSVAKSKSKNITFEVKSPKKNVIKDDLKQNINIIPKVKSPKKNVIKDDLKQNINIIPKKSKARKSLDKNGVTSFSVKSPLTVKRIKASPQTPTNKKAKISQVVMEVDEKDKENHSKTSPNVVKHVTKSKKTSVKKTPRGKSKDELLLSSREKNSSKKSPRKGVKPSPGELLPQSLKKSPSGKKHRK